MEYNEIDIYLKYDQLDTYDLVDLFSGLDKLHKEILNPQYFRDYGRFYFHFYDYPFSNILKIKSIETGQSIRLKFCEGWKPRIRVSNNELEINVPKNLGIPLMILYLLFSGAQKVIEMNGNMLDNELKRLEIELKKHEVYEVLYHKNDNFSRFKRQAERTIEAINLNDSITYFELNGIKLKDARNE
jgi:hypothetical protein